MLPSAFGACFHLASCPNRKRHTNGSGPSFVFGAPVFPEGGQFIQKPASCPIISLPFPLLEVVGERSRIPFAARCFQFSALREMILDKMTNLVQKEECAQVNKPPGCNLNCAVVVIFRRWQICRPFGHVVPVSAPQGPCQQRLPRPVAFVI